MKTSIISIMRHAQPIRQLSPRQTATQQEGTQSSRSHLSGNKHETSTVTADATHTGPEALSMDSGAIPPPKRAPRSLVSPPPKVLDKERYASQPPLPGGSRPVTYAIESPPNFRGSGPDFSSSAPGFRSSAPDLDSQRRLDLALRDEQRKVARLVHQQTLVDEELATKNAMVENLTMELKLMKQRKQSVDSEFAQSTADFMNSQAHWLQQVDALNDEIQGLKTKLGQAQRLMDVQHSELTVLQERETERQIEKHKREMKANRPDNIERNADKMEIHQNRIMIAEMKKLHVRLKAELAEQKELNERLVQTNEEQKDEIDQFQYLLIERTVKGNLNTGDELLSGTLLQDELSGDLSELSEMSGEAKSESNGELAGVPIGEPVGEPVGEHDSTSNASDELNGMNTSNGTSHTEVASSKHLESQDDKRRIAQQQFELRSLQNHNRALKVSLESLVARLLENQSFSRVVEDSVSPHMVDDFRTRMSEYIGRPAGAPWGPAAPSHGGTIRAGAAASMVFNQHYTGTASRRVFSLGVDNEANESHHDIGAIDRADRAGNRSSSLMAGIHRRSVSPLASTTIAKTAMPGFGSSTSLASIESTNGANGTAPPHQAARVESLTGIRKLRMH